MSARLALGVVGAIAIAYGVFLLLSRQHLGDWVEVGAWLAVGVVVHDAQRGPLAIGAGVVLARVAPLPARAPLAAGLVVLVSATLLAVPVLGRFGARADNSTLLDRPYLLGWLALTALVAVGVLGGMLLRSRRDEGGDGAGTRAGR